MKRHPVVCFLAPAMAGCGLGMGWAWPPSAPGTGAVMEHFEIATVAEQSAHFRRVLWTGEHTQLVIMTIQPGDEIGAEVHEHNDQILSFVSGVGRADVAGETREVKQGDIVVVPAGVTHNFTNTGPNPLVLYTVYGPPEHEDGTVHETKAEADAAEAAEHGHESGL